nr:hypothetical protein [Bryocella elongata]
MQKAERRYLECQPAGCQFHPEFKSKPLEPHPLFRNFVKASYANRGLKKAEDVVKAEVRA